MPNRTFPPDILTILVREAAGSPSFSDEPFCRRLSLESGPYGIRIVVLPLPDDNQAALPKQGFVYVDDQWRAVPLPATKLVMDRSLQPLPQTWRQQLSAPGPGARTTYWSASLPGKWKVHQILSRDSETKELLPQTALFQPHVRWETWLERWPQGLFFKPVSGTHGKNTFRLARGTEPSTWVIDGRNHSNEPFHWLFQTPERVSSRLHACSSRRRLLIQPYLDLSHHGRPFDIRALMQKDGRGRWLLTGCMVREGPEKTLTSNLHGGGKAYPALPYLQDRFGASEANALLEQIKQAAGRIPPLLERHFGRLAELGLDFGADSDGRLWLLEANSKPGRSSFAKADDPQLFRRVHTRPLAYARYLLQQHVLADVYRPTKMPNTSSIAGLKPIRNHGS
ncbi:YheC/YheD family protein [Paenibacillus sp. FSL W8-0426]|uniref:YheC/YheD family endospore coat-associated protein n=1 Tax=Paenibacillus sp. FSL W8-0426 TaxID=2921714 RepID=UPI0030DAEE5D